jgi:hypothetical protein
MIAALGVCAGTTAAAGTPGSLSLEGVRGLVTVKGQGAALGRLGKGTLQIVDLTPGDRFFPRINGIARGSSPFVRGRNVTFYVPGGRYRVVVRGEGISLSTRGNGFAVLDGEPGVDGLAGVWGIGDIDCHVATDRCQPVPADRFRVTFGATEEPTRPAATTP